MTDAERFHTQMNLAFNLSRFAKTHEAILRLQDKFHYYRHKYEQAKARESKQREPQPVSSYHTQRYRGKVS